MAMDNVAIHNYFNARTISITHARTHARIYASYANPSAPTIGI